MSQSHYMWGVLVRRGGRAVECTGLENQQGFIALRGFESHPLRHKLKMGLAAPVLFIGEWKPC